MSIEETIGDVCDLPIGLPRKAMLESARNLGPRRAGLACYASSPQCRAQALNILDGQSQLHRIILMLHRISGVGFSEG